MYQRVGGFVRFLLRLALRTVAALALIILTIMFVRAFESRRMPDLQTWHTEVPPHEFTADDERPGFDLDAYLAAEERLFAGLAGHAVSAAEHGRYLRYVAGGPSDPASFERDWNRTTELSTCQPSGPRKSDIVCRSTAEADSNRACAEATAPSMEISFIVTRMASPPIFFPSIMAR